MIKKDKKKLSKRMKPSNSKSVKGMKFSKLFIYLGILFIWALKFRKLSTGIFKSPSTTLPPKSNKFQYVLGT